MEYIFVIILLLVDITYLSLFGGGFASMVERIQQSSFTLNYLGAILAYLFIAFALYYFIIRERRSVMSAFILGFTLYGVFDMTNLAIFKDYEWKHAIIDTLWGGILLSTTTYITYLMYEIL
jgi:uncharacterized membrane protein